MAETDIEELIDPLIDEIKKRLKRLPSDEQIATRIYITLNILGDDVIRSLGTLELAKGLLLDQSASDVQPPKNLVYIR